MAYSTVCPKCNTKDSISLDNAPSWVYPTPPAKDYGWFLVLLADGFGILICWVIYIWLYTQTIHDAFTLKDEVGMILIINLGLLVLILKWNYQLLGCLSYIGYAFIIFGLARLVSFEQDWISVIVMITITVLFNKAWVIKNKTDDLYLLQMHEWHVLRRYLEVYCYCKKDNILFDPYTMKVYTIEGFANFVNLSWRESIKDLVKTP